jgi:hypothetical protein
MKAQRLTAQMDTKVFNAIRNVMFYTSEEGGVHMNVEVLKRNRAVVTNWIAKTLAARRGADEAPVRRKRSGET